jgi:hypothetical protein
MGLVTLLRVDRGRKAKTPAAVCSKPLPCCKPPQARARTLHNQRSRNAHLRGLDGCFELAHAGGGLCLQVEGGTLDGAERELHDGWPSVQRLDANNTGTRQRGRTAQPKVGCQGLRSRLAPSCPIATASCFLVYISVVADDGGQCKRCQQD